MKLDREMMKGILAYNLEQRGYTLQDFENILKTAGVEKHGQDLVGTVTKILSLGGKAAVPLIEALAVSALIAGGLTGLGAYQGYKMFDSTNELIQEKQKEKYRIMEANKQLEKLINERYF